MLPTSTIVRRARRKRPATFIAIANVDLRSAQRSDITNRPHKNPLQNSTSLYGHESTINPEFVDQPSFLTHFAHSSTPRFIFCARQSVLSAICALEHDNWNHSLPFQDRVVAALWAKLLKLVGVFITRSEAMEQRSTPARLSSSQRRADRLHRH